MFKVIDLNKIINSFEEFLHALFDKKHNIEVLFSEVPALIEADESQLEVALTQLVMNASEAIEGRGTITIEIIRESRQEAGEPFSTCSVIVSDTGQGMSDETARRAVEPFFTTKKIGQGPGLGLSMVYGFMQQCKGQLKIESQIGEGTRITMTFPDASDIEQ